MIQIYTDGVNPKNTLVFFNDKYWKNLLDFTFKVDVNSFYVTCQANFMPLEDEFKIDKEHINLSVLETFKELIEIRSDGTSNNTFILVNKMPKAFIQSFTLNASTEKVEIEYTTIRNGERIKCELKDLLKSKF